MTFPGFLNRCDASSASSFFVKFDAGRATIAMVTQVLPIPQNTYYAQIHRQKKKRLDIAANLLEALYRYYPNPHCELNYTTPFELLIATILSAQCTDVRVNMVTEKLFKKISRSEAFCRGRSG